MKRLLILGAIFLTVAAVVPVSAAGDPGVYASNLKWTTPCGEGVNGRGYYSVDGGWNAPPGYTITQRQWQNSVIEGSFDDTYSYVSPGEYPSGTIYDWVPGDGDYGWTVTISDPAGNFVSRGTVYGNCVTGELYLKGNNIFGMLPPDSSERVMGTVLADTAVYAEANPAMALDAVLTAGQTWFVVGQTTGTDGNMWYEVFVGGAHNGWVPASSMALEGPVPE